MELSEAALLACAARGSAAVKFHCARWNSLINSKVNVVPRRHSFLTLLFDTLS